MSIYSLPPRRATPGQPAASPWPALAALLGCLALAPGFAWATRPSAESIRDEARRNPQRPVLPGLENLERQVTTDAGCAFADRDQIFVAVDDARAHPDFRHRAELPMATGDGDILLLSLEGRIVKLDRVTRGDTITGYRSDDGRFELAIRLVRRHPWGSSKVGVLTLRRGNAKRVLAVEGDCRGERPIRRAASPPAPPAPP